MDDQTIQQIEDLLLQGIGHQDIINQIAAAQGDDPAIAKQTAEYLKKKDQPEQAGPSASQSEVFSLGSEKTDPTLIEGTPQYDEDLTKRYEQLQGVTNLSGASDFFTDQRNQELFPDAYKQTKRQQDVANGLFEALPNAQTSQDIEDLFKGAGYDKDAFDDYMETLKTVDVYEYSRIKAEDDLRNLLGASATGELDVNAEYNKNEQDILDNTEERLRLEAKAAYGLSPEDGARLLQLETDLEQDQAQRDRLTEMINSQIDDTFSQLQENLSPEAFEVYSVYSSVMYSSAIKNLLEQANRLDLTEEEVASLAARLDNGNITFDQASQELKDKERALYPNTASLVENTMTEAPLAEAEKAIKDAVDLMTEGMDEDQAARLRANIERELSKNKLLDVDFDGDKRIAPMRFEDSLLSKMRLGRTPLTLGMLVGEDGLPTSGANLWMERVRPIYEPIERAATGVVDMFTNFTGGVVNVIDMIKPLADSGKISNEDVQEYIKLYNESLKEGQTKFLRKDDGDMTTEGKFNAAADSAAFTLIQAVARKHKGLAIALLWTGMTNKTHEELKGTKFYEDMDAVGRGLYVNFTTATEFGPEWFGNSVLMGRTGLGGLFKAGPRALYSNSARYLLASAPGAAMRMGVEYGTELSTAVLQNMQNNFKSIYLDPENGVQVPLLTKREAKDILDVTMILGGGVNLATSISNNVKRRDDIKAFGKEVDELFSQLQNASPEMQGDIINKIMAKQDKLSAKFVDSTRYYDWLAENDPMAFAGIAQANKKMEDALEVIRDPKSNQAQIARAKAELSVAMESKFEADFTSFYDYQRTLPVEDQAKLDQRKRFNLDDITEEKTKIAELQERKKNGEDVSSQLALAEYKLSQLLDYQGKLDELQEGLNKKPEEGLGDAKRKAASFLRSAEAQEEAERLSSLTDSPLSSDVIANVASLSKDGETAFALDSDGHVIGTIKYGSERNPAAKMPPTARVTEDKVEGLKAMGFVEIDRDDQSGLVAMVNQTDADLITLAGAISEEMNMNEKLLKLQNAGIIYGNVRSAAHRRFKVENMAQLLASTPTIDVSKLGADVINFYNDNKGDIDSLAELMKQNVEQRSVDDLTGAAPIGDKTLKNPLAKAAAKAAELAGLKVLVGDDAQMFNEATNRDDYLEGGVIAGLYKGGDVIYINENATAKDVYEELAHAKITRSLLDKDGNIRRDIADQLESILSQDPFLKAQLDSKERTYREIFKQSISEKDLNDEKLAEMISIYAANAASINPSIVQKMTNFIKGVLGKDIEIDLNKDSLDSIISKLNDSQAAGRKLKFHVDPLQETAERETQENNSTYAKKEDWLTGRPVRIVVNNWEGRGRTIVSREETFSNYGHFRNFINKMTGNGAISPSLQVHMSWTDASGKQRVLRMPSVNPNKPQTTPIWRTFAERELDKQRAAAVRADNTFNELGELKSMLTASGMSSEAANELLDWNGFGRGFNVSMPNETKMAFLRQAVGDYLAEQEMTTPQSVVSYSTYMEVSEALESTLREYIGEDEVLRLLPGEYRSNEEYSKAVDKALMNLVGDEEAVKAFHNAIMGSDGVPTNAEIQNLLVGVAQKMHSAAGGTKRAIGSGLKSQQKVISVLKPGLAHLMSTDTGKEFVNFFKDFDAGLEKHFEFVGDQHGIGADQLMGGKDLYKGFVAVLSNGNKAGINISLADYIFAAYMSGDRAKFDLAINQVRNIGEYSTMPGIPSRATTHAKQLEKIVELFEQDPATFRERMLAEQTVKKRRAPQSKHVQPMKEVMAMVAFGDNPKIGAFFANLLGDESVIAMDSHFVAENHRAQGKKTGYDFKGLGKMADLLNGLTEEQLASRGIKKPKNGFNPSSHRVLIEDISRQIWSPASKRTAKGKAARKGLKPWEDTLRKWYDNSINNRMQTTPDGREDRHLLYTITTKLADELGITPAAVQQLEFLDNHLIRQVLGKGDQVPLTFADVFDQRVESMFYSKIPTQLATAQVKIDDQALRLEINDSDLVPMGFVATDTFDVIDEIEDGGLTVYSNPLGANPKVGSKVTIDPKNRYSGGKPIVRASGTTATAVVVSGVNFFESEGGRISGEVVEQVQSAEETKGMRIENGIEIDFRGDGWYDENGNMLKTAGVVHAIGDKRYASGEIIYAEDFEMEAQAEARALEGAFEQNMDFDEALRVTFPVEQSAGGEFATAYSTYMRGTAARIVDSVNFNKDLREAIAANPANFIETSNQKEVMEALQHMSIPEILTYMRADKLGELKTTESFGPLAAITLINRYNASGDTEAAAAMVADLAATGTSVGRLLRQFAELKTSTPESMANTIIQMGERGGKTLDDGTKGKINEQSRIVFELHQKAQELYTRGQQGEDVWKDYQKALKDLATAEKDLDIISNSVIERTWGELIRQTVQGNLLTTMSQATNVVANLSNFIPKTMVDLSAYPVEGLLSKAFPDWYGKNAQLDRKASGSSYLYGLSRFGVGFMESLDEIATGKRTQDLTEWRISRSMMPVHSLIAAFSSDLPQAKTKAGEFNQRAKLLFQGTFGAPAESMFRLLSLGDTPFRRYAEGLELRQIADARGLEGRELQQFLRFPPNDVIEQARQRGLQFTFQDNSSTAQLAEYTLGALANGMGRPFRKIKGFDGEEFFNTIIRLNVPYVRTPANLLEETLTYASPAIAVARVGKHLAEGNPREASENLAKGMIGQTVTMTSMYLIANGLVSGPPDDDKAVRNLQYDTFPPNCINVSGLQRLLKGEDPAYQPGDQFKNYQKLGLFGGMMGAVASSTDIQAAKEISQNPFTATQAFKTAFGFDNVATLSYMMDQSFLQGLNSSLQVLSISNPDEAERAWSQWVEGMFRSISAVPLPNQLSALNRTQREFLPDMRSTDMAVRLENTLRDRTFSTNELPIRYNWKGEPIRQTPAGADAAAYQMFDVTKSREGSADPVSMEALRLFQETGEPIDVLKTPYFASSVFRNVKSPKFTRGKAKKAYQKMEKLQFVEDGVEFKMQFNAEQINEAMRLAGQLRYQESLNFVESDRYKNMNDEERISEFESINAKYNGLIEYDPQGGLLPHSRYLIMEFEKEYLQRLEDGEEFETN
jgi:hypothetical protein